MTLLTTFARWEFTILVTAFTGVIVYKFLSGGINTRGLLREKTATGVGRVSAARVQLLLATGAMAGYLLYFVMRYQGFPQLDTKWVLMLGGSHSVYLGAKGVLSLFNTQPR